MPLPPTTTATRPATGPNPAGQAGKLRGYRAEIEGLRAFAVLMVVVYHVWLGRVSGGVDVFLFISSFLLTFTLLRRFDRGPVSLPAYWIHLFKRLLPLSVTTILGTVAAVYLLVPSVRWQSLQNEALASLFYFENWALAFNSVDYYAADRGAVSPFQHFWSLSIQGQIFILWPILIFACALIARKFRISLRAVVAGVFGLIFLSSLAFSVHQTATNQAFAYFDTRTRLWEFALGSLVALALPYLRPGKHLGVALGWAGLAAMVSVGLVVQVQQAFPGYIALAPILAACAVIVAGQTGSRLGVDRVLSSRPLVLLGESSYALYLVHWPILILTLFVQGKPQPDFGTGAVIIVASIVVAFVITRAIEAPIRTSRWAEARVRRGAAVIIVLVLITLLPVMGWKWLLEARTAAVQAAGISQDNPGARALDDGYEFAGDPNAPTIPAPEIAGKDWARLAGSCRDEPAPDPTPGAYELCFESGPPDAEKTVAVVGSSHPRQMTPAFAELAKDEGWRLLSITQGSCTYGIFNEQRPAKCNEWNADVRSYLLELSPDLVILQSTLASKDSPEETLSPDFEETVRDLTASGIEVVGVRDNPRFTVNMVECALTHGAESPECTFPVEEKLAAENPASALEGIENYHNLDFTDIYCPGGLCQPVVGNVYVYMDYNHVSTPYSSSMSRVLRERLSENLTWLSLR